MRISIYLFCLSSLLLDPVCAKPSSHFPSEVLPFIDNYCIDCHDETLQKGDVNLENLMSVTPENAAMWTRVWEVIALKKMPPPKKKQPELMDRHLISNLITDELSESLKEHGGFTKHKHPKKANLLDHDLLFNTDLKKLNLEPSSSPARLWRLHPQEHLVRLGDLISRLPYNPKTPNARMRGDLIAPNTLGDVKVFFGMDNYLFSVGGEFAKQASAQGFASVISLEKTHGLRSYAHMYSVNDSEATQLNILAGKIIRYMVYGPSILTVPENIAKDKNSFKRPDKKIHRTLNGTPRGIYYDDVFRRPKTPVYDVFQGEKVVKKQIEAAVEFLYETLSHRKITKTKVDHYTSMTLVSIEELGKVEGLTLGLASIFLDPHCWFRSELVEGVRPDRYGRRKLQGEELMLAINSSLSFIEPNEQLQTALAKGKLVSKKDVEREVRHILNSPEIRTPKILQFFREYFDYELAPRICKDDKQIGRYGLSSLNHTHATNQMVKDTDMLIEMALNKDHQVLKTILTTDQFIMGKDYFDSMYYANENKLEKTYQKSDIKNKTKPEDRPPNFGGKGIPQDFGKLASELFETNAKTIKKINVRESGFEKNRTSRSALHQAKSLRRKGILTQPAWLIAHSDAMDNHPIHRGIWVLERLLGKAVPDVPITVDAMLPDEPHHSLRHRMRVTRKKECWSCHQEMDPLGLPFEMYNHLGQERDLELGKPVDTSGEIVGSGDPKLDGPVANAIDMIERLAESERVEQVFVRHVFRYWMGRNETLNDAPILREAHRAYRDSQGSFKELLVSLITSDAFLYRKNELTRP